MEALKKNTQSYEPHCCVLTFKHLLKCPMKTKLAILGLFASLCGEMAIYFETHVAKMIVVLHSPCSNTDTGPFIALYQ